MNKRTVAATADTAVRTIIDIDPYYVRRNAEGAFDPCGRDDAEAISKNGVVYAITDTPVPIGPVIDSEGHATDVMQYAPRAVLYEEEDGALTVNLIHQGTEHTDQITDLEAGTIDLADAMDASVVGTEDALMELGDMTADLLARVAALETAQEEE